jgi:hypothetical protein
MNNREYLVQKYDDHPKMQDGLNEAARNGWEPIHYAIQGTETRRSWHYIILVRTVAETHS